MAWRDVVLGCMLVCGTYVRKAGGGREEGGGGGGRGGGGGGGGVSGLELELGDVASIFS